MDFAEFRRILWRHKLLATIVAVAVIDATLLFVVSKPRVYQADATISVYPTKTNPTAAYGTFVSTLLGTYAQLMKSHTFLDRVAAELPFKTNGSKLQSAVSLNPVPNTTVLKLSAQSGVAADAAAMARFTADAFVAQLQTSNAFNAQITDQPT